MRIELTEQQQHALDTEPGPPTIVDPRTNQTYVLIRTELYKRLEALFNDLDTEAAFQAQIESAAEAGWNDPGLDVYNELDPRRGS